MDRAIFYPVDIPRYPQIALCHFRKQKALKFRCTGRKQILKRIYWQVVTSGPSQNA